MLITTRNMELNYHHKTKILRVVITIAVVLTLIGSVILIIRAWPESFKLSKGSRDSTSSDEVDEVDDLISEVGKLIVLPFGEIPTIATVTGEDLVKGEPFFRNAVNGDRVLIYTNARKAYLYRPSEKIIIEVGVVNINQPVVEEITPTQTPAEPSPTSASPSATILPQP